MSAYRSLWHLCVYRPKLRQNHPMGFHLENFFLCDARELTVCAVAPLIHESLTKILTPDKCPEKIRTLLTDIVTVVGQVRDFLLRAI